MKRCLLITLTSISVTSIKKTSFAQTIEKSSAEKVPEQKASPDKSLPPLPTETIKKIESEQTQKSTQKPKNFSGCQQFPARFVYLNGKNISSVRSQELTNVKVTVDEIGNINISAPHYDVQQDSSYHPLFASEVPALKGMIDKKSKPMEPAPTKLLDGDLSPIESLKANGTDKN